MDYNENERRVRPTHTGEILQPRRGVSWRAILAGTLTVVATVFLLNLIGLAVGFGSINPGEEANPLSGVGTGALIWWIVTHLIALFLGGWVAGLSGRSMSTNGGVIQGFLTWCLYSIISIWLVTSAVGSIISGVGSVVGSTLSTVGKSVGSAASSLTPQQNQRMNMSLDQVRNEVYALLEDTGREELDPDRLENQAQETREEARQEIQNNDYSSARAEINAIIERARNNFDGTFEALDKEALANVLSERTNMSREEAMRQIESREQQYENIRRDAEEQLNNLGENAEDAADNATDVASKAAMWLSIALVLGAITAALGGLTGTKQLKGYYNDRVDDPRRV